MNGLDYVILGTMGFLLVRGMKIGFFSEVSSSKFVLLFSFFGANKAMPAVLSAVKESAALAQSNRLFIFFLTVAVIFVVLKYLLSSLRRMSQKSVILSGVGRLLGAALGACEGWLLCFAFIFILVSVPLTRSSKTVQKSTLLHLFPQRISLSHLSQTGSSYLRQVTPELKSSAAAGLQTARERLASP